jgi:hypothetical protein
VLSCRRDSTLTRRLLSTPTTELSRSPSTDPNPCVRTATCCVAFSAFRHASSLRSENTHMTV